MSNALPAESAESHDRPVMPGRSKLRGAYESGPLRIDFDAYEVAVRGKPVHLTRRQYDLLCFFVKRPNRVFSRGEILRHVWSAGARVTPRTVDVHVHRLRLALEHDPSNPELLVNVRSVGYRFNDRLFRGKIAAPENLSVS